MHPPDLKGAQENACLADLAASSRQLSVVYRPLDELKPDPKNPRTHSARHVRQIAKSISTFGFTVPVLIDADLKVIAGHGRLLACQELGWATVPTIGVEQIVRRALK